MAHQFDTGLSAPLRTIILDGCVTTLSGLKMVPNGGYLAAVEPFGGVVRSWTDVDGVDRLAETFGGLAPSMAVALGARDSGPRGSGTAHGALDSIEILVYHISNNGRGLSLGRMTQDAESIASNIADPGLHVMMEHAEELLVGAKFGNTPTIKEIRRDREDELLTRENLTIWLQSFRVTVTRATNANRNVTQLLTSLRTRLIQETGEVNLPAPKTKPTTIDFNRDDLPT